VSWWQRFDSFQRRHRWAGYPLGVVYKFGDDQGNYLAALLTYYAFLSVFPLLLLGSAILGFVLQGNEHLQHQILDSTLARFPVIGDDLRAPGGLKGSGIAVAVGILTSLYGGLGVANATQNALNVAWAVPRNRRPNPIMIRLRSLVLLAFSGFAIIATTLIANTTIGVSALGGDLQPGVRWLITIGTVLVNAAIFMVIFRLAAAHKHPIHQDIPGALFVSVIWQLLQYVGSAYVSRVVQDQSATTGAFAVVLGMLAWIYLGAMAVIAAIEINVVLANRLYPRALLTPFTDNVDLTDADRLVYTRYAKAQGHKGFQSVDVTFDESFRQRRGQKMAAEEPIEQRAEEVREDRDALP
jgi:YihY family inner membrane protein